MLDAAGEQRRAGQSDGQLGQLTGSSSPLLRVHISGSNNLPIFGEQAVGSSPLVSTRAGDNGGHYRDRAGGSRHCVVARFRAVFFQLCESAVTSELANGTSHVTILKVCGTLYGVLVWRKTRGEAP